MQYESSTGVRRPKKLVRNVLAQWKEFFKSLDGVRLFDKYEYLLISG